MIWNSVIFMTVIDLLIIFAAVYLVIIFIKHKVFILVNHMRLARKRLSLLKRRYLNESCDLS